MDYTGSATINAMGAMGYALVHILYRGLQTEGWWIFLVLATLGLGWTAVRPAARDGGPGELLMHFLAVCAAAVLLYGPQQVNLATVIGARFGAATLGTGPATQGAAPLPTYWIDEIGQAINQTAKRIVSTDTAFLVPMLSQTLREAASNPANFADKSVLANLSAWRFVVAAAMMSDAAFADAIRRQNLEHRLQNPVSPNAKYSSSETVAELAKVVAALDAVNPVLSLGSLVCDNGATLNEITDGYRGARWEPVGGCSTAAPSVAINIVGRTTIAAVPEAREAGTSIDPNLANKAARGAATVGQLVDDHAALVNRTTFTRLSDLYQSIGAGTLVSAGVQAAQDKAFKVLLGEQCTQSGEASCARAFAPVYGELDRMVQAVDIDAKEHGPSWIERFKGAFWKNLAGTLSYIVGVFMTLFAKLVAALTPFGVAMARAIALVLSLLGIYLLLLPDRARDGVVWLIGPIAFANLWGTLYIFWWKITEIFNEWASTLFFNATWFSGDGISGAAVIQFATAIGYTALPFIAWSIVFSMTERLVPRGGVASQLTPVAQAISRAVQGAMLGSVVQRGPGGGQSGPTGGGGGTSRPLGPAVPANPVAPVATFHRAASNSTYANPQSVGGSTTKSHTAAFDQRPRPRSETAAGSLAT